MFSGVYFTEDKIVKYAKKNNDIRGGSDKSNTELILENERLKAELRKLRTERK